MPPAVSPPAQPAQAPALASGVFACEPVSSSADSELLIAPLPQNALPSQQPWPAASQQGAAPGARQGLTPPQPRLHSPQQARTQPHAAGPHGVPLVASGNPAHAGQATGRAGTPLSAPPQSAPVPAPGLRTAAALLPHAPAHAAARVHAGPPQGGAPVEGLEAGGEGAVLCAHGMPLATCSHAVEHLRDVKSFLLDVCEELLDGQPGLHRPDDCMCCTLCMHLFSTSNLASCAGVNTVLSFAFFMLHKHESLSIVLRLNISVC